MPLVKSIHCIRISGYLASLPQAANPFTSWEAYLDMLKGKAAQLVLAGVVTGTPTPSAGNTQIMPQTNAQDYSGFALDPNGAGSAGSAGQFGASTPWAQAAAGNIVVQIDGKTIASALMDQSLSGNQTYINRRTGGFDF